MYVKFLLLSLTVCLSLYSCRPDEPDFTVGKNGKEFNCDILGIVLDEAGKPILNAKVDFNGLKRTTDQFGVYHFNAVPVNVKHNFIRININGYFEGSRSFTTDRKTVIQLKNVLLKKEFSKSFNSISGGEVQEKAIKLIFPSDAIALQAGGQLYKGTVNLAIKYLDPWKETIIDQMPGDMSGLNNNNDRVFLTSYGMAAIEMVSENGEKLQIAAGKHVKMITTIPDNDLDEAPASIPLWYFEESEGYWKEEGSALLTGNEYIGQVSHFSFWNYDAPFPIVILSGRVKDHNGNPVSGVLIKVFQGGRYGFATTNSDGSFSGGIRKDEAIELSFKKSGTNNDCEQPEPILLGPFSEDVTIADIRLSEENLFNYLITAKVSDCHGKPVKNGYATIFRKTDPYLYGVYPVSNGYFGGSVLTCDKSVDIVINVRDLDDITFSDPIELKLAGNRVLSNIQTCNEIDDFLTIVNPELGLNEVVKNHSPQNYFNVLNDGAGVLRAYRSIDSIGFSLLWVYNGLGIQEGTFNIVHEENRSPTMLSYFDGQRNEFQFVSGKVIITQGGIKNVNVIGKYELIMSNKKTFDQSKFTGSFRYYLK